ncbi:WD40-repeat-containing domain protein [Amylocarpus encephaloides]|uniref:WD40-repeat-containing domain protein n=1 Tax=Amylocarpus encephaloides TaxID=45428 RepID=A0A9P7YTL2_9HELO|nr:WD40-repeat-containing domain protein [Amylocarpus encephaloides]
MRYSRTLKSSTQCLPSPDGAFIATILSSKLNIRATRSLETVRVVTLPSEVAASISWFTWSESSTRILVASTENVRVYSATNLQFSANIANPTSGTTKITCVAFGMDENEICVFSEFGLKMAIVSLTTSKSVEISSPKLYTSISAKKGVAYRPRTNNLTLLTRSGGKDIISIHARETQEVVRSWHPETIDAQAIAWSVDGRWLVIFESASQGHKLYVYTADGHLYQVWNGPRPITIGDVDIALGSGVKMFDWNRAGTHLAIGDNSKRITILSTPSFAETLNIHHTAGLRPSETLQVWQEQAVPSQNGGFSREFVLASQPLCPPTSGQTSLNNPEPRTGTNMLSFDHSGTLLATRTDDMPTTLWIWDVRNRALRSAMIFHAPIAKITWHPTIDELLMIRCEESRGIVHLWDPSWEKPLIINFGPQIPGGKVIGKTIARWLPSESSNPALLFSDAQDCLLVSISGSNDGELPWHDAEGSGVDMYGHREESPLNLVPAGEKRPGKVTIEALIDEDSFTRMSSGSGSEDVDDTFHFRKAVG